MEHLKTPGHLQVTDHWCAGLLNRVIKNNYFWGNGIFCHADEPAFHKKVCTTFSGAMENSHSPKKIQFLQTKNY